MEELRIRGGRGRRRKFRFFEREGRIIKWGSVVFGRKMVRKKIKGGRWFDEKWTVGMVLKLCTVSSMDVHVATQSLS